MQTSLPEDYRATPEGTRADEILRSCVHCGFCNATCPTYQLLGDELDGPRGRIYLMKEMLEQQTVETTTVTHLDRCLTCRACETTCPSGVAYGELLEIGRNFVETQGARRPTRVRWLRKWLLRVVPNPRAFARWTALGRLAGPFLGAKLRRQLPPRATPVQGDAAEPAVSEVRRGRVLLLDGCVQRSATPAVNDALERLLKGVGVDVLRLPEEGCCGGLALHLGDEAGASAAMTHNLAALGSVLDEVDAVVSTASGCGVTLKDYGRLLAADPQQATRASEFADKVLDVGEYLTGLDVAWRRADESLEKLALHVPCTLQHGQRRAAPPAALLEAAGYELVPVRDGHLCCGSAGSYSMLEPDLSERLGKNKVAALTGAAPDLIATGNVGCQLHLGGLAEVPVRHWVELLAAEAS